MTDADMPDTGYTWMTKRDLTPFEQEVLDWIEANPGYTSEDIATQLRGYDGNRTDVHDAVEYLVSERYVDRSLTTGSIKRSTI